jgi:hypothetical protein
MEMQYEVRYLVNGEENTMYVEATSAAAASEMVRHKVSGPDDDFELIQVSLVDITADEAPTS